jgi:hypothetical protein
VPGSPIRTPWDHSSVDSSPRPIAASHVLHRLLVPRHPPCALSNLTTKMLASTVQFSTNTQPAAHHHDPPHPHPPPGGTNQAVSRPPPATTQEHNPDRGLVPSGPNRVPPPNPPPRPPAQTPPPHRRPRAHHRRHDRRSDPASVSAQQTPRHRHHTGTHRGHQGQPSPEDNPHREKLLRKEVIQPHLPVRLPCYDFVPIASPTFDGSLHKGWATGFGCCRLS